MRQDLLNYQILRDFLLILIDLKECSGAVIKREKNDDRELPLYCVNGVEMFCYHRNNIVDGEFLGQYDVVIIVSHYNYVYSVCIISDKISSVCMRKNSGSTRF